MLIWDYFCKVMQICYLAERDYQRDVGIKDPSMIFQVIREIHRLKQDNFFNSYIVYDLKSK